MANPHQPKPAKLDRRIVRTRQSLRTALMELVNEKDYEQISVEEIAERANVSRATFYLHFKDKDDLFLNQFYVMAMERVQTFTELPASLWMALVGASDVGKDAALPLVKVFELADKNVSIYKILLRDGSSRRLVDGIRQITSQAFNNFLNAMFETEIEKLRPAVPLDLLATYFSAALLSTMGWWLEQEPRMSPEEITHLFNQLFFPGVKKAFGLGNFQQ
jgi:AcrR family transcriptional regulator